MGEPYDPTRSSYATSERIRLGRSITELVRFWSDPSAEEVAAHESGHAQFAMIDESPHLLVLAYQFGDLDWSDSPFQIHRLTTDHQAWPEGGPEEGILFRTLLVDADTGLIRAMRYDQWPLEFSNAIRVAIAEQLLHEFSDSTAAARLKALYDAHPTPESMVRGRAVAVCSTDGPTLGGTVDLSVHYY